MPNAAKLLRWAWLGWRLAGIWIPTAAMLTRRLKSYPYGKLDQADRAAICKALDSALRTSSLAIERDE